MKRQKLRLCIKAFFVLGLLFLLPIVELRCAGDDDDLSAAWIDIADLEQASLYQWVQDLEIEWVAFEADDEIVKKLSSLPVRTKMNVLEILMEKNSFFLFRVLFYHLLLLSKKIPHKQATMIVQIRGLILRRYKSDELFAHYTGVLQEYYKRNL